MNPNTTPTDPAYPPYPTNPPAVDYRVVHRPKRKRSVWEVIGIVIAVALAIGSLVFVAVAVLVVIAFSSYGSNK